MRAKPDAGRGRDRRVRTCLVAATFAVAGIAVACEPPPQLAISSNPALFPDFDPAVTDYVSRCSASTPVSVSVNAPSDTIVSVNQNQGASGTFTATVHRDIGQRFTIVVGRAGRPTQTYNVRCIPFDFPQWTAQRTGTPQADSYVTVFPVDGFLGTNYPVILDRNGVPLWWAPRSRTFFTTVLSNGNVAWTLLGATGGAEEHRLDGSLVRTINTVSAPSDFHDLITLSNGDYVMATAVQRSGVDLSSWGGPVNATVIDHVFEEITPQGTVAWSWDTLDHIPVTETTAHWRADSANQHSPYDPFHYNSVESTGDGFIISFRHLDAVYKIDRASGAIVWKLGGTQRNESLTVTGDPVFDAGGSFSGQHDARLLPGGAVNLHDNGSGQGRPPRAVTYQIDTTDHTATLLRDLRDPLVTTSACCGSARVLPTGNYVMGWGGSRTLTEMTPAGNRVFLLQLQSGTFYRALPTPPGVLSASALRAGMDAQYGPNVDISPSSGAPGAALTISGMGFAAGETVNVSYKTGLSSPRKVLLCSVTATSIRTFSCSTQVPPEPTAGASGDHTIVTEGATSLIRLKTTFARL